MDGWKGSSMRRIDIRLQGNSLRCSLDLSLSKVALDLPDRGGLPLLA